MTYTVTVTREGDFWLAECVEEPTAHTYASTLSGLRREIADAIILAADLPDDAQIDVSFQPGEGLSTEVAQAIQIGNRRAEARRLEEQLRRDTLTSARALIGHGYSMRDVATAVGLTPGRVAQLVA